MTNKEAMAFAQKAYDEVIEKLAEDINIVRLAEWLAIEHGQTKKQFKYYLESAQELNDYLSVLGYVKKAEDQRLPEPPGFHDALGNEYKCVWVKIKKELK